MLHRNQFREMSLDHDPLHTHPFAVAIIVSRYTDDEDTLIAALLHDTIEE
jgi:(p)ppGpp synthase/HD superfamily hydrolase